jgi:hypothetical protein
VPALKPPKARVDAGHMGRLSWRIAVGPVAVAAVAARPLADHPDRVLPWWLGRPGLWARAGVEEVPFS